MKTLRHSFFTFLLTIAAFVTTTYIACNKDKCDDVVCKTGQVCENGYCRSLLCDNVTCQNGGQCISTTGKCSCLTGYSGTNCEILASKKFAGNYAATETCSGNPKNYIVSIYVTSGGAVTIRINNVGNYHIDIPADIGSDGNSFNFAILKDNVSFIGTGYYSDGNISVAYNIKPYNLSQIECAGTWQRQN